MIKKLKFITLMSLSLIAFSHCGVDYGPVSKCNYSSTSYAVIEKCDGVVKIYTLPTTSPGAISELIEPCPDIAVSYPEILIKLESGRLIAFFQSGNNRFLTELVDGTYVTTDGKGCTFKVDGSEVIW